MFVEWTVSSLRPIAFYAHHEVVLKKLSKYISVSGHNNNTKKKYDKISSNSSNIQTSGTADFFELQKSLFNVRIFTNVKRGFAITRARIDIATILRQGFDNFEVSPTGCRMQRLPEVVINNLKNIKSFKHSIISKNNQTRLFPILEFRQIAQTKEFYYSNLGGSMMIQKEFDYREVTVCGSNM